MLVATTAAENLRTCRLALGISQSRLARLSGVRRFKICLFELGDGALTAEERERISGALQAEADRLRNVSIQIDFSPSAIGDRPGSQL